MSKAAASGPQGPKGKKATGRAAPTKAAKAPAKATSATASSPTGDAAAPVDPTDPARVDPVAAAQEAARVDLAHKREQRDNEAKYYEDRRHEMHLDDIRDLSDYLDGENRFVDRSIVYAHKDFDKILDAHYEGREWAVVSGLNPSGPLHFGHKAMFDVLLWLQRSYGATVFIPITNDETYVVGKAKSLAESTRTAYEEVIPSIIALGFDPAKTHIFVHTDYMPLYKLAVSVSRYTTYNNVRGLFGWTGSENPGTVFYMGALQFASILLPQLPEFGGPKPVVVPVGIDQHPYVSLARDVAHKLRVTPPAEIVWKFLFGLKGPDSKMSASDPENAIFLNDDPADAVRKIKRAYSGGSILKEYHRQHGGVPEVCSVFGLLTHNFLSQPEWQQTFDDYQSGKLLSSDIKDMTTTLIADFLVEHRQRTEDAKSRMDEFLLTRDLPSVTEREFPFAVE